MRRIVVLGAGGQARELRWTLDCLNRAGPSYEFIGFVVSDLDKLGERDSRDSVLGDYGWLRRHRSRFDALALGIGNPVARAKVARELQSEFGEEFWPAIVHPTAVYDQRTCEVGPGVFISAGVVATVNIRFDAYSMANFSCTIGHESRVGVATVINPGANISGGVDLGDQVLVGTGAQVLQYIQVGDRAVIGAGAVVTGDVAAGTTVIGVPAKPRPTRN